MLNIIVLIFRQSVGHPLSVHKNLISFQKSFWSNKVNTRWGGRGCSCSFLLRVHAVRGEREVKWEKSCLAQHAAFKANIMSGRAHLGGMVRRMGKRVNPRKNILLYYMCGGQGWCWLGTWAPYATISMQKINSAVQC